MNIYRASVYVGNYEIEAFADSADKCIKVLVAAYHKNFGSFRENGFKNQADWLKYHGIKAEYIEPIKINSAIVR